jgi:hypothetical protein
MPVNPTPEDRNNPEDASSFRFAPSLFQKGGRADGIFPQDGVRLLLKK